jgi:hypothetical protein
MSRELKCSVAECDFKVELTDADSLTDGFGLLQLHDRQAHAAVAQPDAPRIERPKRPTLQLKQMGCTEEEWTFFKHRWSHYKLLSNITTNLAQHLMECIDIELQQQLYATVGPGITTLSEGQLIQQIEQLAVRARNKLVATKTLRAKKQGPDQPVQSFVAELRAIARECDFKVCVPECSECKQCRCARSVSYTDQMVRDQLVFGLADSEIQQEILATRDISLDDAIIFIVGKESGKWSQKDMVYDAGSLSAVSTYKKGKRDNFTDRKKCGHCGGNAHSDRNSPEDREHSCPAWGKRCQSCESLHHFAKVCKKASLDSKASKVHQSNAAIQLKLFSVGHTIGASPERGAYANCAVESELRHVQFDESRDIWLPEHASPMPTIDVDITLSSGAYLQLKLPTTKVANSKKISGMPANADTGATVCVAGTDILRSLGLGIGCLVPVNARLWTVDNKTRLKVLGAIFLDIASMNHRISVRMCTKQLVYVAEAVGGLFLSRDALTALQVIPRTFPEVGAAAQSQNSIASVSDIVATEHTPDTNAPCGCLTRTVTPPPPAELPLPATPENREALERFLKQYYASSVLNTCEHQPLPHIQGPVLSFATNPDAKPYAVHTPIPVPAHWAKKVKADLDRDCRLGVLEPVPPNTPVTWCHRMVIAPKHNGDPRRTVDMTQLNKVSTRQTHHTVPPFKQALAVPRNTIKTTMDAWNGYHSVTIDAADRHLTTFITPWGRYRYRTAPQGYMASGDAYTHRYDQITADIPNHSRCVDDTILWSMSIDESFHQTTAYMSLVGTKGIVLNPDKFHFGKDTVEFAGFVITPDSVKPLPCHVDSIKNFPTPQNITDIRAFFALVSQVSYAFSTTDEMQPFRDLLKKDGKFYWDANLNALFQRSKERIAEEVIHGIKSFELGRETCLATDWSKTGLGFFLTQKYCPCTAIRPDCCPGGWKVCLVGSRFTSPAESRYAPVEGECLAIADGLKKTRYFTLGCDRLTVATDHKPLLGVLGDKKLEDIDNPRLLKLKEKTLAWTFKMVHVAGKVHVGPDVMSRYATGRDVKFVLDATAPVEGCRDPKSDTLAQIDCSPTVDSNYLNGDARSEVLSSLAAAADPADASPDPEMDVGPFVIASMSIGTKAITWSMVAEACYGDPDMRDLVSTIEEGFPPIQSDLKPNLRAFWKLRQDLDSEDGVPTYRGRAIIPEKLRSSVLSVLHSAHQGTTGMQLRAERSVFWPGITGDIRQIRDGCSTCCKTAPSNSKLEPVSPVVPMYPFQHVVMDYMEMDGTVYGVFADRFSNWVGVYVGAGGAHTLLSIMRREFSEHGIPETCTTDGGPQYTAHDTQQFFADWGIHHRLTSVGNPHANARAEIAVKTCKRLIRDNIGPNGKLDTDCFYAALMTYRNTPDRDTGLSPAEILYGRPLKDFLPVMPGSSSNHDRRTTSLGTWTELAAHRERALGTRSTRDHERWSASAHDLPPLKVGDHVFVQNQSGNYPKRWDKRAVVIEVLQNHQYRVRIDGSRTASLRNRQFLRRFKPVTAEPFVSGQPYPSRRVERAVSQQTVPVPNICYELCDRSSTSMPTEPTDVLSVSAPTDYHRDADHQVTLDPSSVDHREEPENPTR